IVADLTLSIENNLSAENGRTVGSRHPRRIPANEREVTVSGTLIFESTAQLEKFWGSSSGPVATGATEFSLKVVFNAGTDGSLEVTLPKVVYTQLQTQPSGREEIRQS